MIIILLHHRVTGLARATTSLDLLEQQIAYVAKHYSNIFIGEKRKKRLNVCFTFDDAYVDFYHFVFPLLKKYNIKATVAPITKHLIEESRLPMSERLSLLHRFESIEKQDPVSDIYCTYKELKEMLESHLVEIACHTHTHPRLVKYTNLKEELLDSKIILEEKLSTTVSTLIYPYGAYDPVVHSFAQNHFSYILRIGSAINFNWDAKNQLYYRVPCDQMKDPFFPFKPVAHFKHLVRRCLKSIFKKI